jgi:hypothetical protein
VSVTAITLCVASQQVFVVVVVYFVIDSVRKLLDTPSYVALIATVFIPNVFRYGAYLRKYKEG